MGFRDVKARVVRCVHDGRYQHEQRGDINVKNDLAMGAISDADVLALLKNSRGTEYSVAAHHTIAEIDVHIVKRQGWYIKMVFPSR